MQQIADWLNALGLGQYAQRFAENDIDPSVLRDLTDHDLEKIGVSLGHRRKILRAIAELDEIRPRSAPAPRTEPERRQLTVMFADLVGSTALSTRLDPEDLREIISAYHRCCAEQIEKFGGFVARYMGDGVLAYFGYPRADEDDAERAVCAGLALVTAVAGLDAGPEGMLRVRVGIATGLVVIGEGASQEHEVVGETPNLASRLQALAESQTVVIDGSTCRLVGGLFEYVALGSVSITGFSAPVPVWRVIGASAIDSRFEALRVGRTPLLGRDEEIELLMRRWQQATRGDGSVMLISGEAGIGKSRLAETVVERLSDEPHIRLRRFCSPHHQDSALFPTISQLERAAGFRRDDTDQQRLDKLEALLAEASADLSDAVPLIADLLSVRVGDRYPPLSFTPQKRKEKTLGVLLAQLEGLAARRPVLMVFEDVHWIDPTSLDLLDLIVDRVATLRVLLIVTFRPEFAPTWIGRSHVTLISLSRLPRRQRAEMIMRVTGGKALPQEIAEHIIDRTDGVPLFIEELTKAVIESGMLTDAGDRFDATGPVPRLAIPTSLQASLLARLDRLAPVREMAQIGAALGRSFSHELISAVAAMPQRQVDAALAQLVGAELVFQRGTPPDAEYTFKHALVQDAAYSTLLRGRRRQIHARIATTLESEFPEIVATQPQLMAHHCVEAGFNEKAVSYRLKSGQQAVARSAMTEAVSQLQRGLELLANMPEESRPLEHELDLQIALGRALMATRGYSAPVVADTLVRARALAERFDRPDRLAPLLYFQWGFHMVRAEHELAVSLAEQLETLGQTRKDQTIQLLGHYIHGASCYFRGEFVTARALLELCDGLRHPAARATCAAIAVADPHAASLGHLALTLTLLGDLDQGRTRVDETLSEARRLNHPFTVAFVLSKVCAVEAAAGWLHHARRHAEELETLSNEHGFPLWLGLGLLHHGRSVTALGQAQDGLAVLARGLSVLRSAGAVVHTPLALCFLAEAHTKVGHLQEAQNCLVEAAQLIETTDERSSEVELHRLRGDLMNARGDQAAAEQNYYRALAAAKRQSAKTFGLGAATSLVRLWREQGKRAEARDLLALGYGWFTEGFDTPLLRDAKALLDQLA
ncbi:adenylate/guanylate cyclase domain-containing protein [Bradyrhizobium sp. CB1650]|uniref:adenylate/guanylate cyclase domain-containing protein n=1 Tax=Bradyrhizobium sp. CB1650 TaxID=3039153 RepID=UPI0024351006|nr:adenylate/guanylate cyclase domain-containing protein [Bradyrhizobium sp. CB1650]WGD53198.1 adenylate/guanylate cyclase domain-containing protein [Bradyrhizobium sp. CB1650]